jgi:tetratricopeptide (TPR) repeat protein
MKTVFKDKPALFFAAILFFTAIARLYSEPSKTELTSYESIKKLFNSGLYDVAEARAAAFLKSSPASDLAKEVRLVQAQSLYYLGRYEPALDLLKPLTAVSSREKFAATAQYWQAECQIALQQWAAAEISYRQLLKNPELGKLRDDVLLGFAWALFKQKKIAQMDAALAELGGKETSSLARQKARLLSAKIKISVGNLSEAHQILSSLLDSEPRAPVLFEAGYFLGEVLCAKKDFSGAAIAYRKVTENSQARPKPLLAFSHYGLGTALLNLGQSQEAQNAFYKAFTLADKEELQRLALDSFLSGAGKMDNLPNTLRQLKTWFAKNTDRPSTASQILQTAAYARMGGQPELALDLLAEFRDLIQNSPLAPRLDIDLAKAYRANNQPDEAYKLLASKNSIAAPLDDSAGKERDFQLGAAAFEIKNYPEAQKYFRRLVGQKSPFEEAAWIGLLYTFAAEKKLSEFSTSQALFRRSFPDSKHADKILLLNGWILENIGQINEAKALYEKALAANPASETKAQLLLLLADLLYRCGDLTKAEPLYEQFLRDNPEHPAYADTAARLVLAQARGKKITEDEVPVKIRHIWEKNRKSACGPQLLFEIAEHYYNTNDYAKSYSHFAQLHAEYPAHPLAADAAYWGGISAYNHGDYPAAIALLEKVPNQHRFKAESRLAQGKIYQKQLQFENALTIYDSLLSTVKEGPLVAEIGLLRGNCLFALGEKNPQNFDLALLSYTQVPANPAFSPAIVNEAVYRKGKTLEKLGRSSEALAAYLDVLFGGKAGNEQPDSAELVWRTKAGLEAARIKEELRDWKGAIEIYKKLESLGGSEQVQFREIINRIRRNNYFYE